MKTINTYIRAFFSLGWLGWVIALMALVVLFAAFNQSSDAFDAAVERTYVLSELEAFVALDLAEMQVQETQEILIKAYGLGATDALERAKQADQSISETMDWFEEDGSFYGDDGYYSDLTEDIEAFNQARVNHAEMFDNFLNSFDEANNEADDEYLLELTQELEEDNEFLNAALRKMIIDVEQDRQFALAEFPYESNASILVIAIALGVTLLLALAGYQAIAVAVRPLRHLRNKITTIGGDVYRPGEALAGGAAGNLAKALEELALAEQTRNQKAKQEIEDLRQTLYESRRRRLKIYQPGKKTE
ncbi:MAG: hypothetical protein CVU44_15350 [Chloroflexi bacterium HGW-Chloroflexi-6]|nr:MAG: hypothetical protein CVU44_15350 [Chloroflexi bacterium HGW-Chloroflexi-6]